VSIVLDASAVLAFVLDEPGSDVVASRVEGAVLSVVNLCEVVTKTIDRGRSADPLLSSLPGLGVRFEPVTVEDARLAGQLRVRERELGASGVLSLADRACLALASRLQVPALTADRAWADLDLGVDVRLIR
jgi:ribonuclease VapC